jgi:hypothetical protein
VAKEEEKIPVPAAPVEQPAPPKLNTEEAKTEEAPKEVIAELKFYSQFFESKSIYLL